MAMTVYGMTVKRFCLNLNNEQVRNWTISRLEKNYQCTRNELELNYLINMKTFGNVLFRDLDPNGLTTNLNTSIYTNFHKYTFILNIILTVILFAVTSCAYPCDIFYFRR